MSIVYIIVALLMLTLIVSIHEFGHYIVGRKLGIGIVEYAIGMGPRLLSWKKTHKIKGTDKTETITYSVRALPLGGFCAFLGEDEANPDPRAMNNMPAWKRFLTACFCLFDVEVGLRRNYDLELICIDNQSVMMPCF